MKDFVYCAECGIMIDSDQSIENTDNVGFPIWFCSERHKKQFFERDVMRSIFG